MAENENLALILVKSSLNSIFTDSPIGYFSKFANDLFVQTILEFSRFRRISSSTNYNKEVLLQE